MVYQCVKCGKIWGRGRKDDISHGLCRRCLKECLTPIYRQRQLREKNFDCFGKCSGYCDQLTCKYRELCVDSTGNISIQMQK